MAIAALVACAVFILAALRRDIAECRSLSRAFWLPLIWLFMAGSRPFSLWLNPRRALTASTFQDYIQGNPTERIIVGGLMLLGLILLYRRRSRFTIPLRSNLWLALLYGLALVSVGWSDYQGVSIRRWVRAAGDLIMVALLLTEEDRDEALERLMRRCAIIFIPLSVLLTRWFRAYGILYNVHGSPFWVGASLGKNELGLVCAFFGVFLIWRMMRMWPRPSAVDFALVVMIFYLLAGAKSSTSDVVLVLGVLLLVGVNSMKGNRRRINVLIIVSILAILTVQWIAINFMGESITPVFFSATGRDATFTGRTQLWQALIGFGARRPVLGAGYGSFWLAHMTELWTQFDWGPTNAHNGYLDIFLELGLAGLIILLLLIFTTYKKVVGALQDRGPMGRLMLVFLVMTLTHNVMETHFMKPTNFLWIIFIILAMTVKVKPRVEEEPDLEVRPLNF